MNYEHLMRTSHGFTKYCRMAFWTFVRMFRITVSHWSPGCRTHPTIFRNILRWHTKILSIFLYKIGNVFNPNNNDGLTVASNNFNRNLMDTFLLHRVLECRLNLCQAHWIRCEISTLPRFSKTPDKYLPKYL